MVAPEDHTVVPPDSRKARLAQAVQQEVIKGGRIETQGDFNAVVRYGQSTNHTLHLILTILTMGLWGFVWIAMGIIQLLSQQTITIMVDEFGHVLRQKV